MKHMVVFAFLVVGLGLSPAMGLLGGGNIHYPAHREIEAPSRVDGVAHGQETNGNIPSGIFLQETAENQKACTSVENTCPQQDAQPIR